MKKIIFMMGVCFFITLQGCDAGNNGTSENIMSEARQVWIKNKYADVNISGIASKYISPGKKKEEVDQYLKANGFTLHYYPATIKKPEILLASRDIREIFNIFGSHEVRIVVEFENDIVKVARGWLFYHTI
jgi:hypothetical protein